MSKETELQFVTKVSSSPDLQANRKPIAGKNVSEVEATMVPLPAAGGELSDSELEAVAGGRHVNQGLGIDYHNFGTRHG